jgi:hypothetical protein
MLSAVGIKQEAIARWLRIRSPKTLQKHFREELDLGAIEAVAQVGKTHYQMATSGKHPASTIHYLENHRRWLDVQNTVAGPAATPDFIVVLEKKAA